MTIESVTCAICAYSVGLDENHVRVNSELVRTRDNNDRDEYILHTDCWHSISEGWGDPV